MVLPEAFESYTRSVMGATCWERFRNALEESAPVSIRLNPMKSPVGAEDVKGADGFVPWCPQGVYLKSRPPFTFDPMLHGGAYYVQEASSMFLHTVLSQLTIHPVRMLDLCAAPGGKSTLACSCLPEGSVLFSNDTVKPRAQVLSENIQKWGYPNVFVTSNTVSDYRRSGMSFDLILADVPCSGEGMFRKDEAAVSEWSLSAVERCWHLQRDIVSEIWPCLKPGGLLVYSTCTFNLKENEENVKWISESLGAEVVGLKVGQDWNLTGSLLNSFAEPVYRFLPGMTRGEGLFMAILRKHGQLYTDSVKSARDCCLRPESKQLSRLNILYDGPREPIIKGKDVVPDVSAALSLSYEKNAYCQVDVDYATAIRYLRKESLILPAGTPLGIVMVAYRGLPLGFCKNIGSRANNLYPREWKIKSTHVPESIIDII